MMILNLWKPLCRTTSPCYGPLPTDIIVALTEMFNLDNEEANEVDDALLCMVGEGVKELRDAAILTAAA